MTFSTVSRGVIRRRMFVLAATVVGTSALVGFFGTAAAEPIGSTISYEQTVNAALPPASSFAGSAGGDGWALVFDDTNVYNVFHHTSMKMACHSKATAAACSGNGYTAGIKTIKDGTNGFNTGMNPSMYMDTKSGHLFVWGLRLNVPATAYGTTGVVEVDVNSTNANPFVAFHALSRANEGSCYNNNCAVNINAMVTNATMVGTKWYAYNYVYGTASPALPDSRNKLLCFDVSTKSACAGQPYAVQTSGAIQNRKWEGPTIASVGNRVFVDIYDASGNDSLAEIACVDVSSTPANCTGWPIEPVATVSGVGVAATPFPLLNTSGTPIGVCFPGTKNACTDFDGVLQTIPNALKDAGAIGNVSYATARGEALIYGTRMYIQNVVSSDALTNHLWCYDYSTGDLCAGFPAPKSFVSSELNGIYTIQQDPSYPTCLWVNSNAGTKQIQNFDYETAGACGAGGSVLPVENFLEDHSFCQVKEWKTFKLVAPAVGDWTSGTVEFDDSSGIAISGVTTQNIGSDGTIDLSPLALQSHSDFAKIRVKLVGAETSTIDVKMTWTAEWHPECTASGQTALTSTTTTSTSTVATSSTVADSSSTTVAMGGEDTIPNDSDSGSKMTGTPSTGDDATNWLRYGLLLVAIGAFTVAAGLEQRDPDTLN